MNLLPILLGFGHAGLLVLIALAVLFAARFVADRLTPFDDAEEVETRGNLAAALARAGLYLAVLIGTMGALAQTGGLPLAQEAGNFALGGALAAAAAMLGQWLLRKVLLPGVRLREAVASDNVAVGLVELALGVATGLVAYGAFAGEGGGYALAAVYVGIGLAALAATVLALDRLAGGLVEGVRAGSRPAGLLLGGQIVGVGILLENAINGPSGGWAADLANVALWFAVGVLFSLAAAFLVDLLFLPKSRRADWVRDDRLAPALLQTAVHVALAALVALAV